MKDIDFDELDRAVGSALGTDNNANPDTSAPSVVSVSDDVSKADTTPLESGSAPAMTKPASPARRRGQFLDMVHPSADMRSTTPLPSTARKTIAPINADTAPELVSEKLAEETPDSFSSYPDSAASVAAEPTSGSQVIDVSATPDTPVEHKAWPDPIDFAPQVTSEDSSKAGTAITEEPTFVPTEIAVSDEAEATEPSQTPFVTDAKVDKRPLGAFASAEEESEEPVESAHAADAAQLAPEPDASTPEFNSDINSIEAAGVAMVEEESAGTPEMSVAQPVELTPDEKPAETPASDAVVVTPEPVPAMTADAPSPHDGIAQSIPQQYKSADVKKDDDAHSLFDTKEYHQPLLPDGKKKSKKGVLIVVLLVVLLIVGGALGYIAYTMGI